MKHGFRPRRTPAKPITYGEFVRQMVSNCAKSLGLPRRLVENKQVNYSSQRRRR